MRFFTTLGIFLVAAAASVAALPVPYAAGSLVMCNFYDNASKDADFVRRFCEGDLLQDDGKELDVFTIRAVGHTEISNDDGGGTGNNGGNNGGGTSGGGNNGGGTSGGSGDPGSGGGNGKRTKAV